MTTSRSAPEFEHPLDIFGQDPATGFATPFIFFWPLPENEETSTIIARLRAGLETLTDAVPWLAGKVVKRPSHPNDAYPYKIVPSGSAPKLIVRDYRTALNVPSMDELTKENFPIRLLDENVLSPVNVLPGKAGEERDAVPTIQCNQLRGGLAINIVGNHQVLDGTGQEQLVYLLDQACRGEAFDEEEIATANLDRTRIIQPYGSDWQPPLDTTYINPSPPTPATKLEDRPDSTHSDRNEIRIMPPHLHRRRPHRPHLAIPRPSPPPPRAFPDAQKHPRARRQPAPLPRHPTRLPGPNRQQRLLAPHAARTRKPPARYRRNPAAPRH
jgi:hypothetical protein